MTLKFPKELILGGEEWKTQPFRFNVNAINTVQSLPEGYKKLDYLETNGSKNIKTNIVGNARIVGQVQANIIKGSSSLLLASAQGSPGGTWFGEALSTGKWGFSNAAGGYANIPTTTKVNFDLSFDGAGARGPVNGELISRSATVTQGNWMIFSSTSNTFYFTGKLFFLKFYQNNVLVGDFIPAQDPNNITGLYDKVSKEFFRL